jgi:hypothetical protein
MHSFRSKLKENEKSEQEESTGAEGTAGGREVVEETSESETDREEFLRFSQLALGD